MQCTRCGANNSDGARFCSNCGAQLAVPRAPEGERRFVTVLFADVVGSTALGENIDPEQLAEIMNGAFDFFTSSVDRYGGTVARLMGDAVLAIFGAPVAHEDDPLRAIHAGLAIRDSAQRYAETVQAQYGADFRVRVGIHSGLAVLALVGNEIKMEYTAMGDTANVASRLQSAADPGTVLISADTYHLVASAVEVRPRGLLQLKGRSQELDTFEVVAAAGGRQRGVEGLASPLVGREEELRLLQAAVAGAGEGHGAFIVVTAEAGLGKSRLVAEARKNAADIVWLEGRGLSYGQTLAYYPWRQIIYAAIDAGENEPPDGIRTRLADAVEGDDRLLLERLLGVESSEARAMADELSGIALARHIADAVRRWLVTLGTTGPLVLVFDDLHWADRASIDLLAGVADLVSGAPLTIVAIMRPDRATPGWDALKGIRERVGERYHHLELEPLSGGDSRALLDNLLDVRDLPESVRNLILRRSEGNPFFLEEVIRSLIDSSHIVKEANGWRATRDIAQATIPDTLMGVLASRIDRLPEETKRVAQTAAVIGRIFRFPVLTATVARSGSGIGDLAPHVGTLTGEELVRERARLPEMEYIFKHALTQEAAYDLLLLKRRKEYHRVVGEVLEQLYPEQARTLAPMMAHHFLRGEDWLRAATYSVTAARSAYQLFAMSEAAEHAEAAVIALRNLPDAPPEMVVDAILVWAEVSLKTVPYEQIIERLEEAERLARELGDVRRLASVLNWIGGTYTMSGFPGRGFPALVEGQRLATEIGDEQLGVLPLFVSTMWLVDSDPRGALEQLEHVIELAQRYHQRPIQGHALGVLGMAFARLGRFADAEEAIARAQALMPEIDAPVKLIDIDVVTALAYLDMGDVQQALKHSERAVTLARQVGSTECSMYALYCTGIGQLRNAAADVAQQAFQESLALVPVGSEVVGYLPKSGMAMAQALTDSPETLAALEAARASAESLHDDYTAAIVATALVEATLRQNNLVKADETLAGVLEYYRRNEMLPYIAGALTLLADLRERQGRSDEAEEARAEAADLARELEIRARTRTVGPAA